MSKRYSLYIGRFQPFHDGHKWCVRQMINNGKMVCIAVMDIHDSEPDKNPHTYDEVLKRIYDKMHDDIQMGNVKVMRIPPIESVNYGRDVGYELNEFFPPADIRKISATKVRSEQNDTNI